MELVDRFFRAPERSFFLFGPRGTGKSTWFTTSLARAVCVDLLDPAQERSYLARPERLGEVVRAAPARAAIVIDEIQKVPELLSMVHLLMEEDHGRLFVLTGSSARKLKRSGTNLLGGRAVLRTMHPFMAGELGPDFDLERALTSGLLPLVVAAEDPWDVLRAYAGLYLKEEVQAEGLVRNIGAFARFLEAVSFSHAALLNVTSVARECEVLRKTVEGYIEILEDLLLAWRIPAFTRRAGRKLAGHPKFYLFDAGVFRSLRPSGPLDRPEEIYGAALEGLVAQHLRAWCEYGHRNTELFFWRTRGGLEVDFVLYGPDEFRAIEVKNSDKVRPGDLRSLKEFAKDYPESRQLLLYRGTQRLERDNIVCIPCGEFLRELHPAKCLQDAADP